MKHKVVRSKDVHVRIKKTEDGHSIGIAVSKVRPVPGTDFKIWKLVDADFRLPYEFDCEGVKLKPRVILKIYCKMTGPRHWQRQRKAVATRVALRKLREGSPFIMPE